MKTLILIFLLMAPVLNATEVTFESIPQLVANKNKRVLAFKKESEAAQFRQGQLSRSFFPKITIGAGYENFTVGRSGSFQQPYYSLETTVNVYNGGIDNLKDQELNLASERKRTELQVALAEELARARELFWQIVYRDAELELLEKMRELNTKNRKAALRRIRSGVATPSDRLEFEIKNLSLNQRMKSMRAERTIHSMNLAVCLGLDPEKPLTIRTNLSHNDEWEQTLQHTHQDHEFFVKPSELLVKELWLKKEQREQAWRPKIDLYAGYYQFNQREENFANSQDRTENAIGVRLTMDLFDTWSSQRESKALGAEAEAMLARSALRKKENEAHIEKEFLELRTLHDQVHDLEKQINMAERYYKTTQIEYARGAKNSPDVLGATEQLENVRRNKNEILRDFHIARSHVLSKLGR